MLAAESRKNCEIDLYSRKIVTKNTLTKVILIAFALRLLTLILIILLSGNLGTGFVTSTSLNDDWRYLEGGRYYAAYANSIFDVDAFYTAYANLGDYIGSAYKFAHPFESTQFWYWFVCILMYITKSEITVRLVNIFFATLSIIYIYKFSKLVYGEKTALRAARLFAYLPYPIIFSCFAYKDNLILLITFYFLYLAAEFRVNNVFKRKKIPIVLILALVFMLTRSGFSILVFAVCLAIALLKKNAKFFKLNRRMILLLLIAVMVVGVLLVKYWDTLSYKMTYYFTEHSNMQGSTISFLSVTGIRDIYKLPFAYIFAIVQPIELFGPITSWYGIVSNLNILMCPISVGATLYIFKKKPDRLVYWLTLGLYLLTIATSINIFRHYYSLFPLVLISYSSFRSQASTTETIVWIIGSVLYMIALIMFYAFM